MTFPIFSQSSHGTPIIYDSGMNSFAKKTSKDKSSIPTKYPIQLVIPLTKAINDTKATRLAMIPKIILVAVLAPFDAASRTEESGLENISNYVIINYLYIDECLTFSYDFSIEQFFTVVKLFSVSG